MSNLIFSPENRLRDRTQEEYARVRAETIQYCSPACLDVSRSPAILWPGWEPCQIIGNVRGVD